MKITPLTEYIGALVEEVSLSDLTDQEFNTLYQAFLRYKVLFFHQQVMTAEEHFQLGQRFGEVEPVHPFFPHHEDRDQIVVLETSKGNPPGESYWHTDMTFQETPPKCSILHAQYVPEVGGDTIWCNMAAVWTDLPDSEKAFLRTLQTSHALHAFEDSRYDKKEEDGQSFAVKKTQGFPPIIRSMMQNHPETQEEILFINEQFTRSVEDISPVESQQLLANLFAKARKEKYQVRFSWQANSVAIWDNRATQHYAVTDYGDLPRKLHRVTVKG